MWISTWSSCREGDAASYCCKCLEFTSIYSSILRVSIEHINNPYSLTYTHTHTHTNTGTKRRSEDSIFREAIPGRVSSSRASREICTPKRPRTRDAVDSKSVQITSHESVATSSKETIGCCKYHAEVLVQHLGKTTSHERSESGCRDVA